MLFIKSSNMEVLFHSGLGLPGHWEMTWCCSREHSSQGNRAKKLPRSRLTYTQSQVEPDTLELKQGRSCGCRGP